jgi:hypothetical protein
MERAYRNVGYVLACLLPIFIVGFWIPYFFQIPHFDESITAAVHIHALLLFSFLVLLIVQPLAIRYNAFSTHRTLGKLTNVLIPFALVFSVLMLWKEYHEHLSAGATIGAARNAEFLSAVQLLLFGALYGVALAAIRQRDIATHMRCMICIALVVLPAGLARIFGYWLNVRQSWSQAICLVVIDVSLLALILFDIRRRSSFRVYAVVLSVYAVIEVLWLALGRPV